MTGHEAVMSWKDPDREDQHNPAGLIDLATSVGGQMADPTHGVATYGCCDTATGSLAICSADCYTGLC